MNIDVKGVDPLGSGVRYFHTYENCEVGMWIIQVEV
jgi:hypothetical protein